MVGRNIKRLRQEKNLTQEIIANYLGISRQAICMWESDKREPSVAMLKKLATLFSTSVDEILKPQGNQGDIEQKEEVDIMALKDRFGKGTITDTMTRKEERMAIKGKAARVNFELMAPGASRVALTGDFNSWDKDGISMTRSKAGLWKTLVSLRSGRYEYKFIVDGQWWTDPLNSNTITNSYGSQNSVKEVKS